MQIKNSVFLIPGGASGLGAATARHLVAAGGKVVIADYNSELGNKVAGELGANAVFVKCDVTKEADIAAAFDAAISKWGRCDGAWANAGIVGLPGPIAEADMDQFDRTMAVLARGVFCTFKHAARVMVPAGTPAAEAAKSVVLPASLGEWAMFNPNYFEVALKAWERESPR